MPIAPPSIPAVGTLLATLVLFAAFAPSPAGADDILSRGLAELRDAVYGMTAPAAELVRKGEALAKHAAGLPLTVRDRELVLARIEFLLGRAWQNEDDKKNAVARHDASILHARAAMKEGETAEGWMAWVAPLAQTAILKDLAYAAVNGPKVTEYSKKALALDPKNTKARLTIAAAMAYPPVLFGGNPTEAVRLLKEILSEPGLAIEPDDLFDIRVGIGTALAKKGDRDGAREWFYKALEVYPGNRYALGELGKLSR